MEIEAVVARLTRPEPWRVGDGGQAGAAATDPGAGRDPSATRPCTDAAASPASTGASSAHSSTVLPPASVSSSPCGGSSRWR